MERPAVGLGEVEADHERGHSRAAARLAEPDAEVEPQALVPTAEAELEEDEFAHRELLGVGKGDAVGGPDEIEHRHVVPAVQGETERQLAQLDADRLVRGSLERRQDQDRRHVELQLGADVDHGVEEPDAAAVDVLGEEARGEAGDGELGENDPAGELEHGGDAEQTGGDVGAGGVRVGGDVNGQKGRRAAEDIPQVTGRDEEERVLAGTAHFGGHAQRRLAGPAAVGSVTEREPDEQNDVVFGAGIVVRQVDRHLAAQADEVAAVDLEGQAFEACRRRVARRARPDELGAAAHAAVVEADDPLGELDDRREDRADLLEPEHPELADEEADPLLGKARPAEDLGNPLGLGKVEAHVRAFEAEAATLRVAPDERRNRGEELDVEIFPVGDEALGRVEDQADVGDQEVERLVAGPLVDPDHVPGRRVAHEVAEHEFFPVGAEPELRQVEAEPERQRRAVGGEDRLDLSVGLRRHGAGCERPFAGRERMVQQRHPVGDQLERELRGAIARGTEDERSEGELAREDDLAGEHGVRVVPDLADPPHADAGDELFRRRSELVQQIGGKVREKLGKRDVIVHVIPPTAPAVQRPGRVSRKTPLSPARFVGRSVSVFPLTIAGTRSPHHGLTKMETEVEPVRRGYKLGYSPSAVFIADYWWAPAGVTSGRK